MAKSKSCRCCGSKKKCNGAHVYVIELKSEVIADLKFREKTGISENFTGRCFYVGQTSAHRVECRFKQHRAKKSSRRRGESFPCTCKNGKPVDIPYHYGNGGNPFVRKYAKGLAYELFSHLNPLPKKYEPKVAEAELAESLRNQGFAVHYN
jgi:hypothetical protein